MLGGRSDCALPGLVLVGNDQAWLHWHDGELERRHAPGYFVRRAEPQGRWSMLTPTTA